MTTPGGGKPRPYVLGAGGGRTPDPGPRIPRLPGGDERRPYEDVPDIAGADP